MEDLCVVSIRPNVSKAFAIVLAKDIFGLKGISEDAVVEFASYEDRNFCIQAQSKFDARNSIASSKQVKPVEEVENLGEKRYILKVMNARVTYSQLGVIDADDAAMQHMNMLTEEGVVCPMSLPAVDGTFKKLVSIPTRTDFISKESLQIIENKTKSNHSLADDIGSGIDADGNEVMIFKHYVRLLSFVPGRILSSVPITDHLLYDAGLLAAKVTDIFKSFHHPALQRRTSLWDINSIMVLREYLNAVHDIALRRKIDAFLRRYEDVAQPILSQLPKQTVHSDISKENALVELNENRYEICGLIDFGDVSYSCRALEVASCMADLGMLRGEKIQDCGLILAGFLSKTSLHAKEMGLLYFLLVGRLVQCIVLGSYQETKLAEHNDYTVELTTESIKCFQEFFVYLGRESELIDIWKSIAAASISNS